MNKMLLTLCGAAILLFTGCAQSPAAIAPVPPSVEVSAVVPECAAPVQKRPTANYQVAESSEDGLFIRVATNGAATQQAAKEIIDAYANDYDRIDICEPGHTERGEECMSFMNGVLVDYRTGKSVEL